MNKATAIWTLNRYRSLPLSTRSTHFANINSRKPVWWLDIANTEIFDPAQPVVNLVLAERNGSLHYLCVPKDRLIKNMGGFVVRNDKDVISLELSALDHDRFTDVRPRSGRLLFAEFLIKC